MSKLVIIGSAVLLGAVALYAAQVIAANWQARKNFTSGYCWLRPEPNPVALPELIVAPSGTFLPNPLRQLNRAIFGFGLKDAAIQAPHFAVAYRTSTGEIKIAAWSYKTFRFWTEPQSALTLFVEKLDLEACIAANAGQNNSS